MVVLRKWRVLGLGVTPKLHYDPALDGLRGFAVLAVIMCHAYNSIAPGGWVGVDMFFVLSGYLITSLLRDEIDQRGTVDLPRFYYRRFLRLMPPLWCLLLIFLPFVLASHHQPGLLKAWLATAGYVMNWARAFVWVPDSGFGHTWSLAAEEQFYLLWPVAFILLRNRRPVAWLAGLTLALVAWRYYLVATGAPAARTYNGFDTHAEPILLGCTLALVALPEAVTRIFCRLWWIWVATFITISLTLSYGGWFDETIGLDLTSLTGAALLIGSKHGPLRKMLIWKPAVFTGKISYTLYLWHYPLIMFMSARWHFTGWKMVIPVALAYAISVISYFTVEAWARRMKRGAISVRPHSSCQTSAGR